MRILARVLGSLVALSLTVAFQISPGALGAVQSQAFLKLNEYYVLFADPVTPSIDREGHFVIALPVARLLLGISVETYQDPTIATLRFSGRTLTIRAGSNLASVDGRTVFLSSAPTFVQDLQTLLVPVTMLARAFSMKSTWDPDRRVLALQDERMQPALSFPNIAEGMILYRAQDTELLTPTEFNLAIVDRKRPLYRLFLRLRQIQGRPLLDGEQAIYIYVQELPRERSGGGGMIFGRGPVLPDGTIEPDPCVQTANGFRCTRLFPWPLVHRQEGTTTWVQSKIGIIVARLGTVRNTQLKGTYAR